ncbi:MAG TPA: beta-propeller fold lactonase family protein [Terriglobales bacterium]|nr:beta-propeller fold lactonase family protein [Terriglobales bacterium]
MQTIARIVLSTVLVLGATFPTLANAQTQARNSESFAVFAMTNAADKNEIISFARDFDGQLHRAGTFMTGGRGSGGTIDPLESQGSLTISHDRELLFAVNAGSGDVTVFRVHGPELARIDRVPSGGSGPTAVAQHGNFVFVLNAGAGNNVTGFYLQSNGKLTRIPNSQAFLSANSVRGGSLAFSSDGRYLLVTEKATNQIDAFQVNPDGTLGSAVVTPSAGPGLFAIVFAPNGTAITSETGNGNGSAVSSYALQMDGTLAGLTASLPTAGRATCWQVVTPDGRFVYTANSATSTISGFQVGIDGTLTPIPGTVVATLPADATDLDIAVSSDGRYLYTLNSRNGTVGILQVEDDGALNSLGQVSGLSPAAGFNGLAAN